MPLKYRPDIDGLRAIAVLAVIFFHTGVPGFTGGFVGVDIFFVISGFLITSIILKDIQQGQFSIARFYERRIRRIFPALFPVIAFTLIVGAYLFDTNAFDEFGKSISATTLFSSNILFWLESGYFAAASLQKPLLHTWSLAVEEQFYIFFPLALVFIHRYLKSRYLLWILIALTLSLGASIYGVSHSPAATFYLVPTRAWELFAGSILAMGVLPIPSSAWLRHLLSVTGLALIVYSVGFYTEATPFPGQNAIAPVLGAWLIIYSNKAGEEMAIGNKVLSIRPLVLIGLISYSLYLWHWPLVAFSKYLMFRSFNGYESAGIILVSLAVSTLSWKYIEQPFRGKQMLLPDRKKLFAIACIVMTTFAGIGGLLHLQNGTFSWNSISGLLPPQKYTKLSGSPEDAVLIGDNSKKASFVLWGDSHAGALAPAVNQMGFKHKISGYVFDAGFTCPIFGVELQNNVFDEKKFNQNVFLFIKAKKIKTVFLAAAWSGYVDSPDVVIDGKNEKSTPARLDLILSSLINTIKVLQDLGIDVYVVLDVPNWNDNPIRRLYLNKRYPNIEYFSENVRQITVGDTYSKYNQKFNFLLFNRGDVINKRHVLDAGSYFGSDNASSIIVQNNRMLYSDSNHLSVEGALFVAPLFDESFKQMEAENKVANLLTCGDLPNPYKK